MAVFQGLARGLDGKTTNLRFTSSKISGKSIKEHLFDLTNVPPHDQRLVSGTQQIYEETVIEASTDGFFPTIHLLLRLPGGKGGFGSLLRGAATKAGQKKTKNNDACRDMSGRRLRHVNAEKKLEAWNAEAEERKLEKIAEDFIKKKAKEMKKSGSGDSADKYLEKYREDSRMCMEKVEASVRESLLRAENLKRKVIPASEIKSKRLKMLDGSDSDDDDESSGDEDEEKSVVLDGRKHSEENRDGEGCSTSFSNGQSDGECSGSGSAQSNLEEENSLIIHLGGQESEGVHDALEASTIEELVHSNGDNLPQSESISSLQAVQNSDGVVDLVEEKGAVELVEERGSVELVEEKGSAELKSCAIEQLAVVPSENNVEQAKPLDFNEYNSATEMEALGMERLKNELQAHGLKCGGTLQERAARLFLLKTTPLEKLPKKLLAKK